MIRVFLWAPPVAPLFLHSLEVRLKLGRRNPSISPGAPEAK